MPHPRFNALDPGKSVYKFKQFYIAPYRHDDFEESSVQCEPGWAEWWSVVGVDQDGNDTVVHADFDPFEIARIARQINLENPAKQWFYRDEQNGPTTVTLDLTDIIDDLTMFIHDDLPDAEDEDARVDDFDNHDLTPLREALADYTDYRGLDTALDPYVPHPND